MTFSLELCPPGQDCLVQKAVTLWLHSVAFFLPHFLVMAFVCIHVNHTRMLDPKVAVHRVIFQRFKACGVVSGVGFI